VQKAVIPKAVPAYQEVGPTKLIGRVCDCVIQCQSSRMSADTLNKHWKENKSASFGFKMMQKMGWDESKGLGKDENGRVDNIKVSKREVGLGLGSDAVVTLAEKGWSATSSSFESVLSLLNETYKKDKKDKKSKKEKKEKKAKKVTPIISVGMK
jgi:hypothetical protein